MKKAFLLASVLFISVISTACINNFAVQELNNKAKAFMDKGDYASAIERLKSSIDLDGDVFETHYNLAVAYTKAEDYQNAIKTYNQAIELNSDFADAYYSRAVCCENLAKSIISGEVIVNDDNTISKPNPEDEKKEISENSKKMIVDLLKDAVADYEIYQDKNHTTDDREFVQDKVKELQLIIAENTVL